MPQYNKVYSPALGREMEYKVYGGEGLLCLALPTENGRFYDYENYGMAEALRPWIEKGQLQLVCADSIDAETWMNNWEDPRRAIEQHEKWFLYLTMELMPALRAQNLSSPKAVVTGCSLGATHASNLFFRRPDLFGSLLGLSGIYGARDYFHGYMDELVYNNSPLDFLRNMPEQHPYMELYRGSKIILCAGQGPWESDYVKSTGYLQRLLRHMDVPATVDYWGQDASHDWEWWRKQLPYFMERLI